MRSAMKTRFAGLMLAVAVVLPVTGAPAIAAQEGLSATSDGDPGTTLLPPLPLSVGEGAPCTGASDQTATGAVWSQSALGLQQAQRLSRGAGVTVAVVDTGVASDVPGLTGRVTPVEDAGEDCVGHGTFAAGLIAAAPEKGSGVIGVAPEATVIALRGTDEQGVPSTSRVSSGIRTAADKGAQVIYVGHTLRTGQAELTAAVAYAAQHDALVIAPAAPDEVPKEELGADSEMPQGPYWPAAVPGVLAVVDSGPGGVRQDKAPPAYEPDLSAPGSSMVSVGPAGSGHYIGSGASLAAAATAGAAALVRSYRPELTAAEVSRQLLATAYPADIPRLDPYAGLSVVPEQGKAAPAAKAVPARLPEPADAGPRNRALAVAGAGLAIVLLLGGMAAVIPRGRARSWLPPGRGQEDTPAGREAGSA
ncbi:S8 family serine peptidase [Streptomyces sp. NPDC102441]|uniref:S8 family serine peptidase n=1 Tax=Streptomyces sp. NPDC102441 TaxID=3366176 RepID=UPI003826F3CE